jgi:hypothetical protein
VTQSQVSREALVFRIEFDPGSEWMVGIHKPCDYDQALEALRSQIARHTYELSERVASEHREALRAIERGDEIAQKPAGAEWSGEPVSVRTDTRLITRAEHDLTVTLKLRISAITAS